MREYSAQARLRTGSESHARSSGMKGTYIKVLNDVVFDELKKIDLKNQ